MELCDKVALITGSAGGLGKEFAVRLLEAGCKGVCLSDVKEAEGEAAERELAARFGEDRVTFKRCEVTCQQSLAEAMNHAEKFFQVCSRFGCMTRGVSLWSLVTCGASAGQCLIQCSPLKRPSVKRPSRFIGQFS